MKNRMNKFIAWFMAFRMVGPIAHIMMVVAFLFGLSLATLFFISIS